MKMPSSLSCGAGTLPAAVASPPVAGSPLRVLSLGAGVQSTTLALMAAAGEVGPMPDVAIFADTQWEPRAVGDHLAWLASGNVLPFPVHVVTAGNIREAILARRNTTGGRFAAIPWFGRVVQPNGAYGDVIGRRQCTSEYKLAPIMRECRRLLGKGPRERIAKGAVEVWIGISTDEAVRMKPARQQWMTNRWPLIEAGMSRQDCLRWIERNGYPAPPKSSCIGCPFHSNAHWRAMRDTSPDEWADAVAVDKALREGPGRGIRAVEYMHPQRVPLDEADLSTQADYHAGDLFGNECEGMCGV